MLLGVSGRGVRLGNTEVAWLQFSPSPHPLCGAWRLEQVPGNLTTIGNSALSLSSLSFSLLTALHDGKQGGCCRSFSDRLCFCFLKIRDKETQEVESRSEKECEGTVCWPSPKSGHIEKGEAAQFPGWLRGEGQLKVSGHTNLMRSVFNHGNAFACYMFLSPPVRPDSWWQYSLDSWQEVVHLMIFFWISVNVYGKYWEPPAKCYLDILISRWDLISLPWFILDLWVNPTNFFPLLEIISIILCLLEQSLGLQGSKSGLLQTNEWVAWDKFLKTKWIFQHQWHERFGVAIAGNVFDLREVSGNVYRESVSRNLRLEREHWKNILFWTFPLPTQNPWWL